MSGAVTRPKLDVKALVSATLELPRDQVGPELEFRSVPEWDSLSHVALMVALEEELGVAIPDELVPQLRSVAAIEAWARGVVDGGVKAGATGVDRVAEVPVPRRNVQRGLAGVAVDRTAISSIEGQAGRLSYRGYSIEDLLEHSTFEETCFLLLRERLPSARELRAFEFEFRSQRELPPEVASLIEDLRGAHPMVVLRTAVSALGGLERSPSPEDPSSLEQAGMRLAAQVGEVVATHASVRQGRPAPTRDDAVSHARYVLDALRGRPASEQEVSLFDRMMILHAEHGANASAFAARVATGTRADLHAAFTSALATFGGSLHGGAAEAVVAMLDAVDDPGRVGGYVERRLAAAEPVYGFGHRVYRTDDPRFSYMRRVAKELAEASGQSRAHQVLEAFVEAMRPHARRGLAPNVDLYTGFLYRALGLPRDLGAPLFSLGRAAGWVAHVAEQLRGNVLIRPDLEYVGPAPRPYEPLSARPEGLSG